MLRKPASFLIITAISFSCLAQTPAVVSTGKPATGHRSSIATTPPIHNINASPKEINKKKRKPGRITVAEKKKHDHRLN